MMRDFIRLLQLAGLLGCGLSLLGLGFALYFRIDFVVQQRPAGAGPETAAGLFQILDAFREPGKTFLLSAILFVLAEMVIRSIRRSPESANADSSYNSSS
jgi:hypothetical protein